MQHEILWLVDNKVILNCVIGELLVDQFTEIDAKIITLMESSPNSQIHVLTDISEMTTMPNVIQMQKLKYIQHPKIGFFITQSRNPVEYFIGQTVGQILKTKYKFVNTLEEGIKFLTEIEQLPDEQKLIQKANMIRQQIHSSKV